MDRKTLLVLCNISSFIKTLRTLAMEMSEVPVCKGGSRGPGGDAPVISRMHKNALFRDKKFKQFSEHSPSPDSSPLGTPPQTPLPCPPFTNLGFALAGLCTLPVAYPSLRGSALSAVRREKQETHQEMR